MIKRVWLGLAVLLAVGDVEAQDVAPAAAKPSPSVNKSEESQLARLLADRRDPQGRRCELRALVGGGNLRYLACGDAGVWVVRLAGGRAEIVEQRPTPGTAGAFFLREGTLWVETTTVQAERLAPVSADAVVMSVPAALAPAAATPAVQPPAAAAEPPQPGAATLAPPAPIPPPAAAPAAAAPAAASNAQPATSLRAPEFEPVEAKVVGLEPGFAIIDMGSAHGVAANDHVSFEQVTTQRIDEDQNAVARERVAVGRAASIGVGRTRVALGIDERIQIGASALPTRDPLTASAFAPPRVGGLWHVGLAARPFLIIDNFGVGGSIEVRAGYRFADPIHLEALVLPLAVATGRDGVIGSGIGLIAGSFDSRFFEVGLGLGGQSVNDPKFDLRAGTGTTLAQRLRIGAVDGGMIEVFTYIMLFHSQFDFSDIQLRGQLPVGDRTWIVVSGGGGALGTGFGEIGLRLLMSGNGDRESFFLSAAIGGTHMFRAEFCPEQEVNCSEIDYTGPHVGVGGEWRL